jgi:hypothetical protein
MLYFVILQYLANKLCNSIKFRMLQTVLLKNFQNLVKVVSSIYPQNIDNAFNNIQKRLTPGRHLSFLGLVIPHSRFRRSKFLSFAAFRKSISLLPLLKFQRLSENTCVTKKKASIIAKQLKIRPFILFYTFS